MEPDKVLRVGTQVSEYTFQFSKEIKDKEKIIEYENWFDEIDFSEEVEKQDDYADIILQIDHKEGISTHHASLWINESNIIIVNGIGAESRSGKISNSQLNSLQNIID